MNTSVVSLGNAGFHVRHGGKEFLTDPFFKEFKWVTGSRAAAAGGIGRCDVVLITHDHWDHFSAREVAAMAEGSGAAVVGPQPVTKALKGLLPPSSLVELEPAVPGGNEKCTGLKTEVAGVAVTAYRTAHGRGHNSYLVELPGLRLFHDGDNERTQILDSAALLDLDILMLCPWQGSGWAEFIDSVKPRHWFLMHMTDEELDQHSRGALFPELCDKLPMEPIALRPGAAWEAGAGHGGK